MQRAVYDPRVSMQHPVVPLGIERLTISICCEELAHYPVPGSMEGVEVPITARGAYGIWSTGQIWMTRGLLQSRRRLFFGLWRLWGVTNELAQVLIGSPSRSTFYSWKKGEGGNLSRDAFERVSYVVGIYKALRILFSDEARADAWVSKPNDAFGGRSALDRMTAGNIGDLSAVRAYLDHARGGGS